VTPEKKTMESRC